MASRTIALLRGINVGGHKKVKMADLRDLFESLGFGRVATYIQSGNVAFDGEASSEVELVGRIEAAIEARFGFEVPVILRRHAELEEVVAACPFGVIDAAAEGTRFAVTFLAAAPGRDRAEDLLAVVQEPDELVVVGREVYLHCPDGLGQSQLTPKVLERRLGVAGTTRNWKTVLRILEMASTA